MFFHLKKKSDRHIQRREDMRENPQIKNIDANKQSV